jgi:hypothetical protein
LSRKAGRSDLERACDRVPGMPREA